MKTQTAQFIEFMLEARTRFVNQLNDLSEDDLRKKLGSSPNSIGFLIRHIGDVELLFAKNVFGKKDIQVIAKTVIDKRDTGEWTNKTELMEYVLHSYSELSHIVGLQSEEDWDTTITTKEFGVKTKAEALGRIVSHTAYHAGQMAIIQKYGLA